MLLLVFNVYISGFIKDLEQSGYGGYFRGCYVGCIPYADDVILLKFCNQTAENARYLLQLPISALRPNIYIGTQGTNGLGIFV